MSRSSTQSDTFDRDESKAKDQMVRASKLKSSLEQRFEKHRHDQNEARLDDIKDKWQARLQMKQEELSEDDTSSSFSASIGRADVVPAADSSTHPVDSQPAAKSALLPRTPMQVGLPSLVPAEEPPTKHRALLKPKARARFPDQGQVSACMGKLSFDADGDLLIKEATTTLGEAGVSSDHFIDIEPDLRWSAAKWSYVGSSCSIRFHSAKDMEIAQDLVRKLRYFDDRGKQVLIKEHGTRRQKKARRQMYDSAEY